MVKKKKIGWDGFSPFPPFPLHVFSLSRLVGISIRSSFHSDNFSMLRYSFNFTMDRPKDYNNAVVPFPDDFRPFDVVDAPCQLEVEIQAFVYHYNLSADTIAILVAEDLCEMRDIRLADPDGNFEQKDYYKESVDDRVVVRKQRMLVRMAFRRMLSANPYAAVVTPLVAAPHIAAPSVAVPSVIAPAPVNSSSSSSSTPSSSSGRLVADGSSSAPAAGKGKSSSSSSKGKAASKRGAAVAFSSSDGSETDRQGDGDDDDDDNGDDAADSADGAGSSRRSSRVPDDVSSLVNELGDEVFLDLLFIY